MREHPWRTAARVISVAVLASIVLMAAKIVIYHYQPAELICRRIAP